MTNVPLIVHTLTRNRIYSKLPFRADIDENTAILYSWRRQRRHSFRAANCPWQSMNVKRIIRDRVYRRSVFSPLIGLLLCPLWLKERMRIKSI